MSLAVNAQLADQPYSVEVVKHHDGVVGNTDLTGFTTYRVFLHLENQTDFVSALYADDNVDNTIPFSLDFDCDLYQHPNGAFLGNNLSAALMEYSPELEYDSWLTIGAENSQSEGEALSAFAEPEAATFLQNFNEGQSMSISDGAIFTLNDEAHPNGEAKLSQFGEKRVLIGQFTTCGDFEWCMNVQIFPARDGGSEIRESICVSNECITGAANANWEAVPASSEEDNNGLISVSTEEEVNALHLYKNQVAGAQLIETVNEQSYTFQNLESGTYYVELDKGNFCRKSTDVIDLRSGATDVDENVNENLNISVYPNPGTGIYQLEVGEEADVRYTVQDLQGRTIVTGNVNNELGEGPVNKELDISSSANGTYIVKVYVNDEVKNIRLIKAD